MPICSYSMRASVSMGTRASLQISEAACAHPGPNPSHDHFSGVSPADLLEYPSPPAEVTQRCWCTRACIARDATPLAVGATQQACQCALSMGPQVDFHTCHARMTSSIDCNVCFRITGPHCHTTMYFACIPRLCIQTQLHDLRLQEHRLLYFCIFCNSSLVFLYFLYFS